MEIIFLLIGLYVFIYLLYFLVFDDLKKCFKIHIRRPLQQVSFQCHILKRYAVQSCITILMLHQIFAIHQSEMNLGYYHVASCQQSEKSYYVIM